MYYNHDQQTPKYPEMILRLYINICETTWRNKSYVGISNFEIIAIKYKYLKKNALFRKIGKYENLYCYLPKYAIEIKKLYYK